jgi:hypothetical protein
VEQAVACVFEIFIHVELVFVLCRFAEPPGNHVAVQQVGPLLHHLPAL